MESLIVRIFLNVYAKLIFTLFAWICCFITNAQPPDIYINEFQASNISTIRNPLNYEYSDWFEIYNSGKEDVNIQGYYFSDDPDDPEKWEVQLDSTVHPGESMLFWADD